MENVSSCDTNVSAIAQNEVIRFYLVSLLWLRENTREKKKKEKKNVNYLVEHDQRNNSS